MSHKWRFCRTGGFTQVRLETGADLTALDELDQKLWVALSCPTGGTEMDPRTLDLIDTDRDGRTRAPELVAAIKWAASVLRNPDELLACSDALPLSAINDQAPEGKVLLASARQVLAALGKEGATSITVDDTSDVTRIFSQTRSGVRAQHFRPSPQVDRDRQADQQTRIESGRTEIALWRRRERAGDARNIADDARVL